MTYSSPGEVLAELRVARGLTQAQLADIAGISQAALSKLEASPVALDADRAAQFAGYLGVTPEFFDRVSAMPEARIYHRKQASLPVTADKRIRAEAAVLHSQVTALLGDDRPELRLRRHQLPDDGSVTPTDIARMVRADLGLGDGPIDDLVDVIESAGAVVHRMDLRSARVDAIATWPAQGVPLVILGNHVPGDRQRFTVAHEIGHAVMHDLPTEDQEAEADEFAAEFLMPAATIRAELSNISPAALVRLKARWKVSMAALARRAKDLGQMDDRQYRRFNIHMSSTGMNRNEPVEIAAERPRLVLKFIDNKLAAGATANTLAEHALMSDADFARHFLEVPA